MSPVKSPEQPPAFVRLEKREFWDNPTGVGYLVKNLPAPIAIPHTVENDHFFLYNPLEDRFEVGYQGSRDIAEQLEMISEANKATPWLQDYRLPRDRHLSFIDTRGNFYNLLWLRELRDISPPNSSILHKHTAVFGMAIGDSYYEVIKPIDDIYCLGHVSHPVTWVALGHDNS